MEAKLDAVNRTLRSLCHKLFGDRSWSAVDLVGSAAWVSVSFRDFKNSLHISWSPEWLIKLALGPYSPYQELLAKNSISSACEYVCFWYFSSCLMFTFPFLLVSIYVIHQWMKMSWTNDSMYLKPMWDPVWETDQLPHTYVHRTQIVLGLFVFHHPLWPKLTWNICQVGVLITDKVDSVPNFLLPSLSKYLRAWPSKAICLSHSQFNSFLVNIARGVPILPAKNLEK